MKDRKIDRGFYKPRSYRFSNVTHQYIKDLAIKFGSQEKALRELINKYKQ